MRARCRAALTPPPPPLSAAALRRCGCAQNGDTPLHYAAFNGQVACVALLVERGANKAAKNEVRCVAPSPAAACYALHRHGRVCAALRSAEAGRTRAREGRNWRRLRFISVCRLSVCRAAQPPAPPRACAPPHAATTAARQRRGTGAGTLAHLCAAATAAAASVCRRRARAAPRARPDAALRGSCAERRAAPRRAASVLACATHTRLRAG